MEQPKDLVWGDGIASSKDRHVLTGAVDGHTIGIVVERYAWIELTGNHMPRGPLLDRFDDVFDKIRRLAETKYREGKVDESGNVHITLDDC